MESRGGGYHLKGGNYQWPYREGFASRSEYQSRVPSSDRIMPPVYDYRHSDTNGNFTGNSCVIGGYVYRGAHMLTELAANNFGDNVSGRIWSLVYNGTNPPS